jgi:thioredoxin-related protein
MPKNLRANIELGLNIVIAISVVVVAVVVVRRFVFQQPVNQVNQEIDQQQQMLLGTRIDVPNVNWGQNKKSLVFFLAKDCIYCEKSAPFYRQLIGEASKRNVKWLAVLPQPVEEGRRYLQSLDLPIDNVQTGLLSSYKVRATPTVLFVDKEGIVKGVWVGASPAREKEMRDRLVALFDA